MSIVITVVIVLLCQIVWIIPFDNYDVNITDSALAPY